MGVAGPVDGGGESQKTEVVVGSAGDVITGMVNDGREVPEKKYTLKYRIKGAHRITCAHLYFGEKNVMGN